MAGSLILKLTCTLLMISMIASAPGAQAAISCGTVTSSLAPCLDYLTTGSAVSAACCSGVESLYSSANTPTDRQEACRCIKSAAASFPTINFAYASSLPSKCGVNIPYEISPSTDCSNEFDDHLTSGSNTYQYSYK